MTTISVPPLAADASAVDGLRDIGRRFYASQWSVGTSSNYSVVLQRDPLRLLVTASGKDKGQLAPTDFVVIDGQGQPVGLGQPRPSAETMLHVVLAAEPSIGSVLHTHSVWGTVLSERFAGDGQLTLAGFEMLKGLHGITTHDTSVAVKVFENTQDIPALARELTACRLAEDPAVRHAFLIRGHGMYTWGRDLDEARRHVEVLEFLFEVVGRLLTVGRPVG